MKTLFFAFFIAFFAYCIPANAQWTDIQFPPLVGEDFYDVFFINPDTGWIVGSVIYRTNDGGYTWHSQGHSYNYDYHLKSVFFINEDTGWVAGEYNELLKTNNGGQTWNPLYLPDSCLFYDLYFVNPDTGWVLGTAYTLQVRRIYHTTDGGNTWEIQKDSGGTSISMISDSVGWVSGGGQMLHTINGGNTWAEQGYYNGWKCYFIDSLYGWMAGQCFIYNTQDGGQNWVMKYDDPFTRDMYSIDFINRDTGWAVGYDPFLSSGGIIINTIDSGETWTEQINTSTRIREIQFLNKDVGYAVAEENVYKTINGGCCGIFDIVQATIIVGINSEETKNKNITNIWPNPVKNELFIDYYSEKDIQIRIDIFDYSYRYLCTLEQESCIKGAKRLSFDVDYLPQGIYFIQVTEMINQNSFFKNYKIIKL